ncbi:hypothetical protein T07_7705 [Trichinella nelsoni]|uniref:Uncharacterized protein n=1 Tax=Trichinella nelsoni TaxID=6336 RepID=A0A0V0SHN0_9BILA|nr:hypothetical protein T07_7705 [Trichinella nelsoni]
MTPADHRAIEISVSTNHVWRERKETTRVNFRRNAKRHTTTLLKSRNSKQQIHRKHCLLKNKDYKHVNDCTVILSVMYHSYVSGRSSDLRALLIAGFIRRVSFVNNGWRELKETPSINWKIPCLAIMFADHRAIENSLYANHVWRERKETTRNKDNKHVNGGLSECTVILCVMYHSNESGRFSDLRAVLIAG